MEKIEKKYRDKEKNDSFSNTQIWNHLQFESKRTHFHSEIWRKPMMKKLKIETFGSRNDSEFNFTHFS